MQTKHRHIQGPTREFLELRSKYGKNGKQDRKEELKKIARH